MKKAVSLPTSLVPKRRRMKCQRDIPLIHSEKKEPRSLALTNTAIKSAKDFGDICGTSSVSESVETALRLVSQLNVYFQLDELKLMIQSLSSETAFEKAEEVNQEELR